MLFPKRLHRHVRRVGGKLVVALAALVLATGVACPRPAIAQTAAEADAHGFDEGDYEFNITNRHNNHDDEVTDWSSAPLGGLHAPRFDLNPFSDGDPWDACIKYMIYANLVEGPAAACVSISNALLGQIGQQDMLTMGFADTDGPLADVYTVASDISTEVIQPVAIGFLGLALVLALLEFSKEVATNKGDHFSQAGNYVWIIVKFAAIMTLISHTTMVCGGIYEVFLWVSSHIAGLLSQSNINSDFFNGYMISMQSLTYNQLGQALVMGVTAVVIVVICAITVLKVLVLVITRMFELYVMTAFAGFPMVMLTVRETRPSGVGYFKKFAGTCLQAAVLIVIIGFAGLFFSVATSVLHVDGDNLGITGTIINILAPVAGCFAFSTMASRSKQIADTIMGAGA